MPRIKYIYSVYDLNKQTHISFHSSLDRALEFALAHQLKIKAWDFKLKAYYSYTDKHSAAVYYKPDNEYKNYSLNGYTHIFIKIPLDENGQLKI